MKLTKKLWSLFLALCLMFSLAYGPAIKAETTDTATPSSITVTLRIEQDEATMAAPVQVQLTEKDRRDFGIGLPTDKWTPLHALAKYMETAAGATDETLGKYILFNLDESTGSAWLNDISTEGDCSNANAHTHASTRGQADVYWMYTVNNAVSSNALNQHVLNDRDSIVLYGLWCCSVYDENWNPLIPSYYTAFDKTEYEATEKEPCNFTLNSYETDDPAKYNPVSGASIIAGKYSDTSTSVTKESAIASCTAKTDEKGSAAITFEEPGTYVLSAYREVRQGETTNCDISRPYAVVTVKPAKKNAGDPAPVQKTDLGTVTPVQKNTAKMPSKVTSLKAKISKTYKKKRRSVKLTWKKASNATAYQVYMSKSKTKGYKKQATVKGLKKTLKLKKGTYYIKVRAYNKSGYFYKYGKFSNVRKVTVKKETKKKKAKTKKKTKK